MIFYPYKKVIIKTQMKPKEIFSVLDEVTFVDVWFEENHKAIFWGSLNPESNKFKLKLNDNTTMLSYITKGRIEEKENSTNIIVSIRWSIIQMIIFSYFFIIAMIVFFGSVFLSLFSFELEGLLMSIICITFFYLINNQLFKTTKIKEKHNAILRKLLKLTNGKIVLTNKV